MPSPVSQPSPVFQSADSLFSLFQGDCNEVFPHFAESFDLIFADPPYFLSNDGLSIQSGKIVSVNKGEWDRCEDIDDIDAFNEQWLANARAALKPAGSIMVRAPTTTSSRLEEHCKGSTLRF